ncbi:hypothetical protein CRUP_003359, partial [Coryphaenoides rupestris]
VGKAMSSNESAAYEIMRSLDVDYVLIIFGGVIGYSGDDINKFLWMVRIAEGEHPKDIRIGNKDIKLQHLEDAFTSEHWLVRIYKVKKQENRDPALHALRTTDATRQKYTSKKTAKRKRGFIKNKLVLKKGKKTTRKSL